MNCGDPFETERGISKLNTRVTARMMKANVLTIVVNSVSAIWTIQISKNIAHINTRFPSHQCDDNTSCLEKIRQIVKDGKTLSFYSKEQQDDMLYDIKKTSDDINQWKPHIMRSVNQECAKQDILAQNPWRQETKTSLVFSFPEPMFLCPWLTRKARWHPEFISFKNTNRIRLSLYYHWFIFQIF